MRCPRDSALLEVRDVEGHIGYRCPECRGAWMPTKYLRTIQHGRVFSYDAFAEALGKAPASAAPIQCPGGCGPLLDVAQSEPAISWCPTCHGIWFDRGELGDLLERIPPAAGPWSIDEQGGSEGTPGRLLPNYHVPPNRRRRMLAGSALLITWGAISLWLDDIYFPGKRGGLHFHGFSAAFVACAMVAAAVNMLSVVADHYDKRPNVRYYRRVARVAAGSSLVFCAAAIVLGFTASAGPAGTDQPLAIWVSVLALGAFIVLGIVLSDSREDSFRALRHTSTEPRVAFDGASATVIFQWRDNESTHRVCKNPQGEYFLCIFMPDGGIYVSPLSRERAMDALRMHRGVFEREFGPRA